MRLNMAVRIAATIAAATLLAAACSSSKAKSPGTQPVGKTHSSKGAGYILASSQDAKTRSTRQR